MNTDSGRNVETKEDEKITELLFKKKGKWHFLFQGDDNDKTKLYIQCIFAMYPLHPILHQLGLQLNYAFHWS